MDRKPNVAEMMEYLDTLVDWEKFALVLPGIKDNPHYVAIIKKNESELSLRKIALYNKWLSVYPGAKWSHVISALEKNNMNKIVEIVKQKLGTESVASSQDSKTVAGAEAGGTPYDRFVKVSDKLPGAISPCFDGIIKTLRARELVGPDYKEELMSIKKLKGVSTAANQLITDLEIRLRSSLNPDKYLKDVCDVFKAQKDLIINELVETIFP